MEQVLRPARFLAGCSGALALCFGAVAHGQGAAEAAPVATPAASGGLDITWNGPEDCDRGDALRAKVARLLSGSQRNASDQIKVTVTVKHKGSRYVAELATTSSAGGGTKRLAGESCEAVALASAVVIALSIDPNASLDAAEPTEEPKPPPRPKPTPPPRQSLPPPPPRYSFGYLYGSVGVLFELLDAPSAFSAAGVGFRHRRFSLELGGALYQPREVVKASRPTAGAKLRLFTGELLGCYAVVPFSIGALDLCPGFRVEHLSAAAFGVSNPDDASVLLGSGVAIARGRLRATSWLSATLDVGIAARPFHPTFVLVGVGNVFEIPVVSPFARTGLVLEF